jgi:hypothetical protein
MLRLFRATSQPDQGRNNMLSGLSILIIGSSHMATPGYLITGLHDSLQKQGAQVHSLGVCGITPSAWLVETWGECGGAERVGKGPLRLSVKRAAKTTPLDQLLQSDRPQLVIVVMGDTLAGYGEPYFPKQWASTEVHRLTRVLIQSNVRCLWVGPAWGDDGGVLDKTNARVRQVSDFLAANVQPCTYVNSLLMSRPGQWPTTDGQHFTDAGYRAWGDAIARAVLQLNPKP